MTIRRRFPRPLLPVLGMTCLANALALTVLLTSMAAHQDVTWRRSASCYTCTPAPGVLTCEHADPGQPLTIYRQSWHITAPGRPVDLAAKLCHGGDRYIWKADR